MWQFQFWTDLEKKALHSLFTQNVYSVVALGSGMVGFFQVFKGEEM